MTGVRAVVADASLLVALFAREVYRDRAMALVRAWDRLGIEIAVPVLFASEAATALNRKYLDQVLSAEDVDLAHERLMQLVMFHHDDPFLSRRARALAARFRRRAIYDFMYVALAEALGCELWTGDLGLVSLTRTSFPFVRHVADTP